MPPSPHPRLHGLLSLLPLALTTGCADPIAKPVLMETPLPIVAGGTLVTPIHPTGAAAWGGDASSPPSLALADGQRIETTAITLGRRSVGTGPQRWLGNSGDWRRVMPGAERSTTMLVASMPSGGLGQSVWMEGRRVPAFWLIPNLGDPESPENSGETPSRLHISRSEAIELLDGELADPMLRWRAELAITRLGYEPPPPSWADPVLHAWAEQSASRWRAAHHRVREVDPELASRLVHVLSRWLVSPTATLPVWPTEAEAIDDLVLAILRPGAGDESIRRIVRAFLDRQPQWLAWVANDAGGVVGGAIAVVNLAATPALLSSRPPDGRWEAHGMLAPDEMAIVPAPTSPTSDTTTANWQVRLGGRTRSLPITSNAIDLMPPGVVIGPFWQDWSLEGLLTGTATAATPGREGWIGGLIQRDPRQNAPDASSSGWVLYIEVRRPPCPLPLPGQSARPLDSVRVAFGNTSRPRAQVRVRCSGATTLEQGTPGARAILATGSDRWAFTLPIDRAWFEPDGTFLVGVQFLPHDGPRSTWPRPALPNQDAIGRVRIDPSSWSLPTSLEHEAGIAGAR
ncbi:MAG: hypothetical protein ACIAS6_02160 [Phycisphaerales bacterium JB060]